jgi:hypothetical protein
MQLNWERYQKVPDTKQAASLLGITAVVIQDMTGKRTKDNPLKVEQNIELNGGLWLRPHTFKTSILNSASINRKLFLLANDFCKPTGLY